MYSAMFCNQRTGLFVQLVFLILLYLNIYLFFFYLLNVGQKCPEKLFLFLRWIL